MPRAKLVIKPDDHRLDPAATMPASPSAPNVFSTWYVKNVKRSPEVKAALVQHNPELACRVSLTFRDQELMKLIRNDAQRPDSPLRSFVAHVDGDPTQVERFKISEGQDLGESKGGAPTLENDLGMAIYPRDQHLILKIKANDALTPRQKSGSSKVQS